MKLRPGLVVTALFLAAPIAGSARGGEGPIPNRPDAVIDLRTEADARLVQGAWRYHDARIVEVGHRLPGPDLKPTGAPNRTHDIEPKAGAADFDDSAWETIPADSLEGRRSSGRLCFGWYRLHVTLPEKVAAFPVAGSTVVFEIVVDDYAEVWVDGKLPIIIGRRGGPVAAGWNSPNRLIVARGARPGQKIQLAVFAINAPLSRPPENYVWIRSATLDFYAPGRVRAGEEVPTEVIRTDPALDSIVPAGAKLERLASGFSFIEGPVWHPDGYLLFSDPNDNAIYRWSEDDGVSIYRAKSGYSGADIGDYGQPGSNGLALDAEGRLAICEHGNRRVTRLEKNGLITVLADRFDGKRLNSPNDLVYRSDGALYFTDPPFGLPRSHDDPRREQPRFGVYCLIDGRLRLASADLRGPNGIAFSPDEKHLYVSNWDTARKVVLRYEAAKDGSLSGGKVFFDITAAPGEEALDGLEVDRAGNVYASGPGGLWIIDSGGRHLGTIRGPELAANFAWGDADARTLYLTARTGLYRIRLLVPGGRSGTLPRDGLGRR
jgi:gluconolactonase